MFGISNKIVTRISLFVTLFVKYPIYHSSISFSYQTQDAKGRYNKLIISDVLFLSSNSIFQKNAKLRRNLEDGMVGLCKFVLCPSVYSRFLYFASIYQFIDDCQ